MSGYFFDLLFVYGTGAGPTAGEGEGLTQATRDFPQALSPRPSDVVCVPPECTSSYCSC